jgi:hypothetical protein
MRKPRRIRILGHYAKPGELYIDLDHLESGFDWPPPSRKFINENKPQGSEYFAGIKMILPMNG